MRRITLWLLSTVAALVLLFSYRTSTMGGGSASSAIAVSGDGGAAADTGSASTAGTTYKGSVAQTRWGPVQVAITVSDGKITTVAVPIYAHLP